jgi:hypothetical protein
MKNSLLIGLFLMGLVGFIQAATDYEADEQIFHVDEPLNDALDDANFIICIMSSMRPDAFVNDGNYIAALNLDDCFAQQNQAFDEQAKAKPTQVGDKNKQAAGDSGSQGEQKDKKPIMESLLNVTRNSTTDPVITKAWIGHNAPEMEGKVYTRIKQTAGMSKDAPNGEFEMHWVVYATESHSQTPESEFQAWGYLKVQGTTISMIEQSREGSSKFTATYADNGDIEGAFATDFGWDESGVFYQSFYKFYINSNDKSYCKKLLRVEKKSPKPLAQKEDLYITQLVNSADYTGLGIEPGEHCFSTKRSEATRNVFSYGVYNQDGSSLDIGLTEMSLQAELTDLAGDKVNVYAHADANNVWVDYEYAHLIDENTVFKQEFFGDEEVQSNKTYRLKPSQISIERYQTAAVSLDSLDAIPFEIDGYLAEHFFGLDNDLTSGDIDYIGYVGFYSAARQEFTITHKDSFYQENNMPRHRREEANYAASSVTDIAIKVSDEYLFEIYLSSSDRSYQINKQALENPADNNQVKTKVVTMVNLSDMQDETLFCVHDCVTAAKVNKTFEDVKERLSEAKSEDEGVDVNKLVRSPYVELNDSIDLDDLVKYKFANNKIYNPDIDGNTPVFRDNLLNDLIGPTDDYYDELRGIELPNSWSVAWGINAGVLVNSSEMNKLKCPHEDGSVGLDRTYCLGENFWRIHNNLDTYYVVRYEVEPNFELFDDSGEAVAFTEPKTFYYTDPSGEDDVRYPLEYFGHGQLSGIPGYVYDTATGNELGEYTYQWKKSYRYIDRFMIPDDAELVDVNDKNKKYKVKALFGEAWLKKASDFKGKYTYSGNIEQIPSDDQLFVEGVLDAADVIGPIPTDSIINNGKPSVIHGEIIYDPTPNPK